MSRYKNKIAKAIATYSGLSPEELTEYLGIYVIEHSKMDDKENDAILITGKTKSVLYMKNDLPTPYKNFLLLHECGHKIQHFQVDGKYSFLQSQCSGKMEQEANYFACLFLLENENLKDVDILNLLKSKGVPENVAIIFLESMGTWYQNKYDELY